MKIIAINHEGKNATIDRLGEYKLNIGKNSIKMPIRAEDKTERED